MTINTEAYINKAVKKNLEVPGLVGEGQQFSTISNFLTTMDTKANAMKTKFNQKMPNIDKSI